MNEDRHLSAREFGHPSVLSLKLTRSEVGDDEWDVVWPVACSCGSTVFEVLDYVGADDRVDRVFQVACKSCNNRLEPLDLSADTESMEDSNWIAELEESVHCASCHRSGAWALRVHFQYEYDLQEQAASDFPEYFEEGLANQWEVIRLWGKCKCGHDVCLLEHEGW